MVIIELIRVLFWISVLFLALSFFGISIQSIVSSPIGQTNLNYLADLSAPVLEFMTPLFLWVSELIRPYAANIQAAP